MRDKNRISGFMRELERVWMQCYPDLRFGQLMMNFLNYVALEHKSDYCQVCGYDGEIKIVDENNELIWECPNCGNRDKNKMNVARRTCGYIGSNFWNKGRTEEIAERYVHLDDHENEVN